MERTEPRLDADLSGLNFRRRAPRWSEPAADARFPLAVAIFMLVALVYPWYSYWVQAHLLARDLQRGAAELSDAMEKESANLDAQLAQRSHSDFETDKQRRIAAVRVIGISDGALPLAVVDFGQSNMWEADEHVCRQTGRWLHRSVAGTVIRVQSARASGTRAPIQQLACP